METKLYVKCECTKDGGREVCAARVSISNIEIFTDERAEQLLRRVKHDCSQKFGVDPDECDAEFIPADEFIKYAGPTLSLMQFARWLGKKKREEQRNIELEEEEES